MNLSTGQKHSIGSEVRVSEIAMAGTEAVIAVVTKKGRRRILGGSFSTALFFSFVYTLSWRVDFGARLQSSSFTPSHSSCSSIFICQCEAFLLNRPQRLFQLAIQSHNMSQDTGIFSVRRPREVSNPSVANCDSNVYTSADPWWHQL
jgi:hypothetical protein